MPPRPPSAEPRRRRGDTSLKSKNKTQKTGGICILGRSGEKKKGKQKSAFDNDFGTRLKGGGWPLSRPAPRRLLRALFLRDWTMNSAPPKTNGSGPAKCNKLGFNRCWRFRFKPTVFREKTNPRTTLMGGGERMFVAQIQKRQVFFSFPTGKDHDSARLLLSGPSPGE